MWELGWVDSVLIRRVWHRVPIANEIAGHVGRGYFAPIRSLLNLPNAIWPTGCLTQTPKASPIMQAMLRVTCNMQVAPCCVSQSAAEAAGRFHLGVLWGTCLGHRDAWLWHETCKHGQHHGPSLSTSTYPLIPLLGVLRTGHMHGRGTWRKDMPIVNSN